MQYETLEQRMAYTYLDTFPGFVPDPEGIGEAEQRALYDLMRALYQLAYDEPTLWVPALHADDAYPSRFMKPYGKPELIQHMRKFTGEMQKLLQTMFDLAASPEPVKVSRRHAAIFAALGIRLGGLGPGWRWMATREGATVSGFAHCFFRRDYPYVSDLYARLLGNPSAWRKLERWMQDRGYKYYHSMQVTASQDSIPMTYANPAWSADPPTGGFEYKIRHTGISCQYDSFVRTPQVLGLCIPGGLKRYLEAFDQMDSMMQSFVVAQTKKCDQCDYCIQTDRSRTRPRAYLTVSHLGKSYALCTYFPGYTYSWNTLDEELADQLIAMLSWMDGFLPS